MGVRRGRDRQLDPHRNTAFPKLGRCSVARPVIPTLHSLYTRHTSRLFPGYKFTRLPRDKRPDYRAFRWAEGDMRRP